MMLVSFVGRVVVVGWPGGGCGWQGVRMVNEPSRHVQHIPWVEDYVQYWFAGNNTIIIIIIIAFFLAST